MHRIIATLVFFAAFLLQQGRGGIRRPIIGLVCHEVDNPPDCFIPASYVKAVEAAGARAAPIFLSQSPDYYRYMVKSLNGIVFIGGYASITTEGGYFEAAKTIFTTVRKLNYDGDHFPILGVCLGFEFLAVLSNLEAANSTLDNCTGTTNSYLPLTFEKDFRKSSLYGKASKEIIDILRTKPVTVNSHQYCLRPETHLRFPWKILTTNKDTAGKRFVSSMENRAAVMAAVQFHPEKNAYEWDGIDDFESGLIASRHFNDWLVGESRKNRHRFPSQAEEVSALIDNYNATFTEYGTTGFRQVYYFRGAQAHPATPAPPGTTLQTGGYY